MQLGWPHLIKELLRLINLPIMGYVPLPCINSDPVLLALLSYTETGGLMLLLVSAWAYARYCSKKEKKSSDDILVRDASAEYFLMLIFSCVFAFGLRASVTLFNRYDENRGLQVISRVAAFAPPSFMFFLCRFHFIKLLREHRAAAKAVAEAKVEVTRKPVRVMAVLKRRERIAAGAVRYLIERYSADGDRRLGSMWVDVGNARPNRGRELRVTTRGELAAALCRKRVFTPKEMTELGLNNDLREDDYIRSSTGRFFIPDPAYIKSAKWPLRSQWQLVVWTRQALLFLVSFMLDLCAGPLRTPAHVFQVVRYGLAGVAIAIFCFFLWLHVTREPCVMRGQHYLEALLLVIDIVAVATACVYGVLTSDGQIEDVVGRAALEIGLGVMVIGSVAGGLAKVMLDVLHEQRYVKEWYLKEGLVKVLDGSVEANKIIDEPIAKALADGAIRVINCRWLIEKGRSGKGYAADAKLPHATKVVAYFAIPSADLLKDVETKRALVELLAMQCGVSTVCITVDVGPRDDSILFPPTSSARLEHLRERDVSARDTLSSRPHKECSGSLKDMTGSTGASAIDLNTIDVVPSPPSSPPAQTTSLQPSPPPSLSAATEVVPPHVRLRRALDEKGLDEIASVIIDDLKLRTIDQLRGLDIEELLEDLQGEGVTLRNHQLRALRAFIDESPLQTGQSEPPLARDPAHATPRANVTLSATPLAGPGASPTQPLPPAIPTLEIEPEPPGGASNRLSRSGSAAERGRAAQLKSAAAATPNPTGTSTCLVTVEFHLSTFKETLLSTERLEQKAKIVEKHIESVNHCKGELPSELDRLDMRFLKAKVERGKAFLPSCQILAKLDETAHEGSKPFLPPERAAQIYNKLGRNSEDMLIELARLLRTSPLLELP